MKRLLVILFLSLVFFLPSFASDEKDKNIPWYLSSPGHYGYSTYPPSLFDPNYLDKHNRWQEYFNSFIYRPQRSAIVVPRPPSFPESFLDGFGKGMSKSIDYHYRKREQERYTETMLKLLRSPTIPKYTAPNYDEMSLKELIAIGLKKGFISDPIEIFKNFDQPKEYKMSPEEKQANWDRIKELDRIIEQKYKKREKLNEYLKSLGLPKMPDDFDAGMFFDGNEWIYWDGKKWARKKKG